MDDHRKPPGDEPAPWRAADALSRAVRELATNPDSPTSLRILSAVNASMRPRGAAVQQVLEALAEQIERPSAGADLAVAAATKHWEAVCQTALTDELLQDWRREARDLSESRQRVPPPIEAVVVGVDARTDTGYDLGVHLEGLRGTWHRLWAAIAMGRAWGDSAEQRECVATVRAQFDEQLGRALAADEWARLYEHACRHGDAMASRLRQGPAGGFDQPAGDGA